MIIKCKQKNLYKLKLIVVVCWRKLLWDFDCLPSITTVVPFQVPHKLYYFHFCQIKKKQYWMLKISKIQSRHPKSNPQPVQQSYETFRQSNQNHNKKLMETLIMLMNLFLIYQKFQNQKLKHWIKIIKLY
jgi:hypothetical protein